MAYSWAEPFARPALVNGAAMVAVAPHGWPSAAIGFTIERGKIAPAEHGPRLRSLPSVVDQAARGLQALPHGLPGGV